MRIADFVKESFDPPIKSDPALKDVRNLWDRPHMARLKHQQLKAGAKVLPYTLLYYQPGLVTHAGLRGETILTGNMSGCFLFRYRRQGQLRVAHVGTDLEHPELSKEAKKVWKDYVARPDITDVWGYDPAKQVSMRLLTEAMALGGGAIIGIFDTNGNPMIGVLAEDKVTHKVRLVGLDNAFLQPWAQIANDKKFQ